MATVYLAEDLKHQRKVAVKVLRADLAASLGPERFLREVTIAANLQHPHVLPLYDSGQADGFLYYVMPYVEGTSLRQKLIREGELPIPDAVRILRDVADAMAYAHQHGVVHRDIKPENVMLSGRHALVTDFGVAKAVSEATGRQTLTTAGVALGTPAYMAPEQAAADPHTDHRADIYAFGVVAYELLTGRPPFTGASPQAILAAHVTTAADPVTKFRASIPPALAALVMRCLEKKPADRWQSAEELIPQLEAVLTPSGGMTPTFTQPISAVAAPTVVPRRRGPLFLAGAAVMLAGAIGAALYFSKGAANSMEGGTVVVLPLTSRSDESSDALLGEGIADAVGARLSRVPSLQVLSATAVRAMQTKVQDPLDAARALKAQWVVAGTLRRGEGGVTAAVEVIRASSGVQRWSGSFHPTVATLVSLDAEIAESVAVVLAGTHGSARQTSEVRVGTTDPEAYRLFLLGKASIARRTESSANQAVRYFGLAVARDSAFSPAWASIGTARVIQYSWESWKADVPRDSLPRVARLAIDRALHFDSLSVAAWMADGMLASWTGDFSRAKHSLDIAVRLDSLNADSWFFLGVMYGADILNQYDVAELLLRKSISIDPSLQNRWRHLAMVIARTGRLPEAESLLDTTLALGDWAGAFEERARVRFFRGNGSRALEDLARLERLTGRGDTYSDALYRIATGDVGPAHAWLNQHPLAGLGTPPTFAEEVLIGQVARMDAALGMRREALAALGRLPPSVSTWAALHDYSYHAFGTDPEFQRLLARSRPAFLSKP